MVTQLITTISGLIVSLVALFRVDDTDLYVFNSGINSENDAVDKAQKLLNSWHEMLKVTGVNLKLSKHC